MAKFPIERAPERIEAAPLPRAALDVDVGGVGEAVAGLGASIAAIGEKFQQAKDMTDMTESETMMLVQFDQLKSNYALDTDYSTMLSRWSKDADKIPESLNKNVSGRVRRAREALFLKYRRQYAVKINDTARGKQISDGRAKHDEGLDMILRTGGRFAPDRAESLIRGTAAAGYISAEEAQKDRARILPEIAYYSAYDMIEAMPEDVEGIIKLHPDLMPDMKIQLRNKAKQVITQADIEQQQKDNAISNEFLKLLINKLDPTKPQLTFEQIVNSPMSLDAKEAWFTKLRVFDNYSIEKMEDAFRDRGSVLADIYEGIYRDAITDDEIRGAVGKGLSPTTAQSLITNREERSQPQYKETDQMFKRLFGWRPVIGFPTNFANAFYEKTLREWEGQVRERKLTGHEIVDLGREIARPYFIEHLGKMMLYQEKDISEIVELALGEEKEVEKIDQAAEITEAESPEETEAVAPARVEELVSEWLETAPKTTEKEINVISPDGVTGTIPENQREAAIAEGYRIVE